MTTWQALLWLWLSLPPARPYDAPLPPFWQTGSIVRTNAFHFGARPHSDDIGDVAVTLQITAQAISL